MSPGDVLWEVQLMMGKQSRREDCPLVEISILLFHCCSVLFQGITFGRRGNKLDLYYSPSMGHSDAAPVPVVVFVYGGAWGSGDRSIYCLLALQMAKELNASVICPDYSIFPKVNHL